MSIEHCHPSFVKNRKLLPQNIDCRASIDLLPILTWTSLPLVWQDNPIKPCQERSDGLLTLLTQSCNLIKDVEIQKNFEYKFLLINPHRKVIVNLKKINYKFWLDHCLHKWLTKSPKIICDPRFFVKVRKMFEIAENDLACGCHYDFRRLKYTAKSRSVLKADFQAQNKSRILNPSCATLWRKIVSTTFMKDCSSSEKQL